MSEYKIIRGDDEKTFTDEQKFRETVDFLDREGEDFETVEPGDAKPDGGEPGDAESTPSLREDPIGHLEHINSSFVNTIKGTDAISKQGFRYIQAELDITTESEVVSWTDDPMGVVVWARAELPDGRAAEAHGEGYITESDIDDNEFVRYADTRAKNRAISDLTSAGALAVSELKSGGGR